MSPLCPCSNQGTSESDEILVELPRKLWQSITFVFVGVCVLCVCVCSVCLCWRRLPMLNYWRQALGIIGFTQDTCYHKSKKTFFLYRKESILIYLCQLIKACNPTHATWSSSCEFATLHTTQLWPDHNFFFQGVDHTKPIHNKKPWSKLMWFIFFWLHAIGQTATTVFS